MGRRVVQSRRMKLLCSVVLGTAFGQYQDYGAYGYAQYSAYEYDQYGNKKNKNKNNYYVEPAYTGKQYNTVDADKGMFNGLKCWRCDARVSSDVDVADGAGKNAFFDCLADGATEDCRGEARVCLTETRARYDRVYAIHASCKSPDACVSMWRRNARFTLPFMLFGKHTDTDGDATVYMDDECRIYSDTDLQKFETHRSQWESVCRTCCVAGKTGGSGACNRAAGSPLSHGCVDDGDAVAGDDCDDNSLANSVQTLAADEYKYETLKTFMTKKLNGLDTDGDLVAKYPMPVEGRNSVTEQKEYRDQNSWEEADQLSRETLDHFDIRHSS